MNTTLVLAFGLFTETSTIKTVHHHHRYHNHHPLVVLSNHDLSFFCLHFISKYCILFFCSNINSCNANNSTICSLPRTEHHDNRCCTNQHQCTLLMMVIETMRRENKWDGVDMSGRCDMTRTTTSMFLLLHEQRRHSMASFGGMIERTLPQQQQLQQGRSPSSLSF